MSTRPDATDESAPVLAEDLFPAAPGRRRTRPRLPSLPALPQLPTAGSLAPLVLAVAGGGATALAGAHLTPLGSGGLAAAALAAGLVCGVIAIRTGTAAGSVAVAGCAAAAAATAHVLLLAPVLVSAVAVAGLVARKIRGVL